MPRAPEPRKPQLPPPPQDLLQEEAYCPKVKPLAQKMRLASSSGIPFPSTGNSWTLSPQVRRDYLCLIRDCPPFMACAGCMSLPTADPGTLSVPDAKRGLSTLPCWPPLRGHLGWATTHACLSLQLCPLHPIKPQTLPCCPPRLPASRIGLRAPNSGVGPCARLGPTNHRLGGHGLRTGTGPRNLGTGGGL